MINTDQTRQVANAVGNWLARELADGPRVCNQSKTGNPHEQMLRVG